MAGNRELLTVEETAQRLGRNPELVRRWLRDGTLRGEKYGSSWMVRSSELTRFSRNAPEKRHRK